MIQKQLILLLKDQQGVLVIFTKKISVID